MKILIDSLVWLLVWKIITKTFARLWSNQFFGSGSSVASWTCDIYCTFCAKWRPWAGLWCQERRVTQHCYQQAQCQHLQTARRPPFPKAAWSSTGNILMPWRFSPVSPSTHKWKQVLTHQRILPIVLIASFCYSWQMARFLWVEEKTFLSRHQIFVLPWHTSQRIQEQENRDSMNSHSERQISNGKKYRGHKIN